MRVHQVLSGAGPFDAVTTQALAYRRLFSEWGWGGRDHAVAIDARVGGGIRPFKALDAAPEDVLLLHYSAYAPKLRSLLELPNPKLLQYHNVTPAKWFWGYEPTVAVHCSLGRRQLPEFAAAVDLAAAVSDYNASELRAAGATDTAVIPILFDEQRLPVTADTGASRERPTNVLFVGRLTPHKRQDELICAFSLYRRHRDPGARLVLVGEPLTKRYGAGLEQLGEELAPGAVEILSGVADAELWRRYARADVFVCLSAHEGFCVPLLEAFHFGVPVIARPVGGIAEVAGDAAILVEDEDPALVAELIHAVVRDGELRAELRERGRRRLAAFAPAQTAAKLRAAVESVALRRRST